MRISDGSSDVCASDLQRLLGQAPGLQEGREVAPLAQLGNPQFDRAGTGLPVPVAVAVAMVTPFGAALAMAGAAQALALQLHQPLGRKADHLAQEDRKSTRLNSSH